MFSYVDGLIIKTCNVAKANYNYVISVNNARRRVQSVAVDCVAM